MNGPFFCERMLLRLPLHNELVGSFVVSGLVAKRRLTPRRHRMVAFDTAFTAAVRMVDRIHDHTAVSRANSHVPRPAGFSDRDVFVIEIAHLADCGDTVD